MSPLQHPGCSAALHVFSSPHLVLLTSCILEVPKTGTLHTDITLQHPFPPGGSKFVLMTFWCLFFALVAFSLSIRVSTAESPVVRAKCLPTRWKHPHSATRWLSRVCLVSAYRGICCPGFHVAMVPSRNFTQRLGKVTLGRITPPNIWLFLSTVLKAPPKFCLGASSAISRSTQM